MPRVKVLQEKYMKNDLEIYIRGQMNKQGMTQEEMGNICKLSRQTFENRLKNQKLTNQDLIRIFTFFDTDPNQIIYFMKEKK